MTTRRADDRQHRARAATASARTERRRGVRAAHRAGRPRRVRLDVKKAIRAGRRGVDRRRRRSAWSRSAITIAWIAAADVSCSTCSTTRSSTRSAASFATRSRASASERSTCRRSSRATSSGAIAASSRSRCVAAGRAVGHRTAPVRRSGRRLSARRTARSPTSA